MIKLTIILFWTLLLVGLIGLAVIVLVLVLVKQPVTLEEAQTFTNSVSIPIYTPPTSTPLLEPEPFQRGLYFSDSNTYFKDSKGTVTMRDAVATESLDACAKACRDYGATGAGTVEGTSKGTCFGYNFSQASTNECTLALDPKQMWGVEGTNDYATKGGWRKSDSTMVASPKVFFNSFADTVYAETVKSATFNFNSADACGNQCLLTGSSGATRCYGYSFSPDQTGSNCLNILDRGQGIKIMHNGSTAFWLQDDHSVNITMPDIKDEYNNVSSIFSVATLPTGGIITSWSLDPHDIVSSQQLTMSKEGSAPEKIEVQLIAWANMQSIYRRKIIINNTANLVSKNASKNGTRANAIAGTNTDIRLPDATCIWGRDNATVDLYSGYLNPSESNMTVSIMALCDNKGAIYVNDALILENIGLSEMASVNAVMRPGYNSIRANLNNPSGQNGFVFRMSKITSESFYGIPILVSNKTDWYMD